MDERVYSKEIVEFVTVGLEFCSRVEQCSESDRDDFILALTRILPLLYVKASLLPTDEPEEDDDILDPLDDDMTDGGEVLDVEDGQTLPAPAGTTLPSPSGGRDSLHLYLREISRFPLLKPEEEHAWDL